jgi:hypothetical protein
MKMADDDLLFKHNGHKTSQSFHTLPEFLFCSRKNWSDDDRESKTELWHFLLLKEATGFAGRMRGCGAFWVGRRANFDLKYCRLRSQRLVDQILFPFAVV